MIGSSKNKLLPLILNLGALFSLGFSPLLEIDPKFKNWGLVKSLDVENAWKIEAGNRRIVVAVIDTGIDSKHESLAQNIWHEREKPSATYGWDFVINQADPKDDHGHGTHVAGIIGAISNPHKGISGVALKVSLMSVKYYSEKNSGKTNLINTVKAINYAIDHGAHIINYSGGGAEFSEAEYLAIKRAEAKGILFVTAAGNEHQDTDQRSNFYYPSAYRLSNTISVAAIDVNNQLLKSSNWGKKSVDLAAPGGEIFSTLPDGKYGYMSGTSQATAFVTGVAALLWAHDPSLTPQKIKSIIMTSVDPLPELQNKLASGGKLNAHSSLLSLQKIQKNKNPSTFLSETTTKNSLPGS